MNIDKLKKSIHARVRLRPPAISVLPTGETVTYDDTWIIDQVSQRGIVRLNNPSTGHFADLGTDHIHHFDSDPPSNTDGLNHGFLTLTMQVFMQGPKLWLEPVGLQREA